MKFKMWLIGLIAGDMTVIMNAEIYGSTHCRKRDVYLADNKFVGTIFALNNKEIICLEDGGVELK